MAAGVFALARFGPFVRIPVGVALFVVMALALGLVPRQRLRTTWEQFVAPISARRSGKQLPEPG